MEPNIPSQPTPPITPAIQSPVIQPVQPTPSNSSNKTKYVLLGLLILLILAAVGGGTYYLGVVKQQPVVQKNNNVVTATTTPIPTSIATATPAMIIQLTPASTPDPTANWKTYTNSAHNYSVKYPSTLAPSEQGIYNTVFNTTQPGGGTPPSFYVSVIPDGFWQNGAIYNDPTSDFITSLYSLKLGEVLTGSDQLEYSKDISVSGLNGRYFVNKQNLNLLPGTTDARVLVKNNGKTYMIGSYYTNQNDQDFQNFLNSFKFTQ